MLNAKTSLNSLLAAQRWFSDWEPRRRYSWPAYCRAGSWCPPERVAGNDRRGSQFALGIFLVLVGIFDSKRVGLADRKFSGNCFAPVRHRFHELYGLLLASF